MNLHLPDLQLIVGLLWGLFLIILFVTYEANRTNKPFIQTLRQYWLGCTISASMVILWGIGVPWYLVWIPGLTVGIIAGYLRNRKAKNEFSSFD